MKCEAVKKQRVSEKKQKHFKHTFLQMTEINEKTKKNQNELMQYNSASLQGWSDSWRQRLHNAANTSFTGANVGFS